FWTTQLIPHILIVGIVFEDIFKESDKVRDEYGVDMSIMKAFSIVMEKCPDLRKEGLAYKVLQWYLCRMEGWFAADADTISLKCRDQVVTKIVSPNFGVKVMVENGKIFVADAVVVAVPFGVLKAKHIEFDPRLPEYKEESITVLVVATENKIALHFDNVFYPNVAILGVATSRPVLVYMPARRLDANFAFFQLKKVFPDTSEPVNPTDMICMNDLRIPIDNMFFAGEATSASYPGTVHGALSTGKMATPEECRTRGKLDILKSFIAKETQVPIQISRL
ncbi:hypothetical protein MKX03_014879, partial [Papaver bracteatum]